MLSALLAAERAEVIRIANKMISDRLVVGTSGNVSLRAGQHVAVTPSGVDYDELQVADIPVVTLDGEVVAGELGPTSELPMHLAAYRRADVQAVVHTHSLHATALSLLRDEVPAAHYQLAEMGGIIQVAEYATFGTEQLAKNMVAALGDRGACVLRNHGTVVVADDLAKAYGRAQQLEWLCELWLTASRVGAPRLLGEAELARCAEKFSSYGQNAR